MNAGYTKELLSAKGAAAACRHVVDATVIACTYVTTLQVIGSLPAAVLLQNSSQHDEVAEDTEVHGPPRSGHESFIQRFNDFQ